MSLAQTSSSKTLIQVSSRSIKHLHRHASHTSSRSLTTQSSPPNAHSLQIIYQSNAIVNHAAGQAGPQPQPPSFPSTSSSSSFFEFSTFTAPSPNTSTNNGSSPPAEPPRNPPPPTPLSSLNPPDQTSSFFASVSSVYSPTPLELWSAESTPPPLDITARLRRRLVFDAGAFGIPKTSLAKPPVRSEATAVDQEGKPEEHGSVRVGEDAYFVKASGALGGVQALGIADGVGGWSRKGIKGANAGRFSALLMSHIASSLPPSSTLQTLLSQTAPDPVKIMQTGYELTLAQATREGLLGSSTALLAVLKGEELRVANVGDCSLWVIREGRMVFKTEEMQHAFNYPFQLGTNSKETPLKDAKSYTVRVEKDDVVLLCTDGLVDNLYDDEILEEIASFSPPSSSCPSPVVSGGGSPTCSPAPTPLSPQRISEALCSRAKIMSASRGSPPKKQPGPDLGGEEAGQKVNSPFGVKARGCGLKFWGGKDDDISVLVAIIGDPNLSPPHA